MSFLMEKTKKFAVSTEQEVDFFIDKYKNIEEGLLVDHKVSYKDTKDGDYFIVTIKVRYLTLAEAKEKVL